MNWRRFFSRKALGDADSASAVLRELIESSKARSGASVNLKTALEAQAVLACARVIAEGLAQVPLKTFRDLGEQGRESARNLPLYEVLYRRPNEFQTAFELREMMGLHLTLCGNFFAFINRVRGNVVELLPFEPGVIKVTRSDWEITYTLYTKEGKRENIPKNNMLHVRGPSMNGWEGLDAVKIARESIGLSLSMEEHTARFFSNGANGGDILSADGDLKPAQITRLRDEWRDNYAGTSNSYKTAIIWGGLKWSSRSTDNRLSQLYELRGFQIEDICQRFRVNPIMIGYSGEKAPTYASAEQMFIAHVVHTMGPWYMRVEQAIDNQLLSDKQREDGYYSKHILAGLLRGAHADRANYYRTMWNIGALNDNEIRAMEEMNPYDGGDNYHTPMNMASADENDSQEEDQ